MESTAVLVIVVELSEVTVLPNWSWIATTGLVVKSVFTTAEEDGCVVIVIWLFAPATSVNVPKLVEPVTPTIEEVPLLVIFPIASGVPADGRTRIFCQVSEFLTPLLVEAVTVKVI